MKTINYIKSLNTDERQILGSCVIFVLGAFFLMYLVSTATNRTEVVEKPVQKQSYELPKSYEKYAEHIYNTK